MTETRKVLVSRPLPEGWVQGSAGHHHAGVDLYVGVKMRAKMRAKAWAVLALADWLDYEAAVKAQEVKP